MCTNYGGTAIICFTILGNEVSKIFRHLPLLRSLLNDEYHPFVDTLSALSALNSAVTGISINADVASLIQSYSAEWNNLHLQFGITIPNKVHIIQSHLLDYINQKKEGLGKNTDQLVESVHRAVHKRFATSSYQVKGMVC